MRLPRLLPSPIVRDISRAILAGALIMSVASCRKPAGDNRKASTEAPRPVQTATATLRPMEKALLVSGTLAAQEDATLSVKAPGRLEQVAVDLGSVVKRGDLIAQVERRDYELRVKQAQAAVAEARAALGLPLEGNEEKFAVEAVATVKQAKAVLEEAKKNRERILSLSTEGIASKSEVDTVEMTHTVAVTRYDSATEEARTRLAVLAQRRTDLEVAEQLLRDTSIYAPFDGAIQSRVASPGEYLQLGTPVASLVRLDPLRLRLEVPERESGYVESNQHARITVDGNTNVFRGTVTRISPAITEQNRMLLVEADVPAQRGLRPGLFVRAQIVVTEHEVTLSVPASSLIVFAGIEKVITVADGKARERTVTTGRRSDGWIEIMSGLKSGEPVVLSPGNLRTGQSVKLMSSNSAVLAGPPEEPSE
jgi:RND family efflux transporter MFP subunit